MPHGHKIATCNYCGTRSVLVFDRARHELTCAACGAPLHDMKAMPQVSEKRADRSGRRAAAGGPVPSYPRETPPGYHARSARPAPRRAKGKPRKPLFRRALEEVWDEIEDLFD